MFRTRPEFEGMPQGLESQSHFTTEELKRLYIRFKEMRDEATNLITAKVFCEIHEIALCPVAAAYVVASQAERSSLEMSIPADAATPARKSEAIPDSLFRTAIDQAPNDNDATPGLTHGNIRGLNYEEFVAALSPLSPLASTNEKFHYLLQAMGVASQGTVITREQYRRFLMSTVGSNMSPPAIEGLIDSVFKPNGVREEGRPKPEEITLSNLTMRFSLLDFASQLTVNF
jgi:Ca2+-binding EF-hand superfamily protein